MLVNCPMLAVGISNPEQQTVSSSTDSISNIYFINDARNARYIPFQFRVGPEYAVETPYKTYTKLTVEPGKYWVSAYSILGQSQSSCQLIESNKNYYFSLGFLFSPKLNIAEESDLKKIKKTAFNNSISIKPAKNSDRTINGISFISNSTSLNKMKEILDKKYDNQSSHSSNTLEAKISIKDRSEGSRLGRYLLGGLAGSETHKGLQVIIVDFYLNGEKIDSFTQLKETRGGFLGGSLDSLAPFFADELISYIDCEYEIKTIM